MLLASPVSPASPASGSACAGSAASSSVSSSRRSRAAAAFTAAFSSPDRARCEHEVGSPSWKGSTRGEAAPLVRMAATHVSSLRVPPSAAWRRSPRAASPSSPCQHGRHHLRQRRRPAPCQRSPRQLAGHRQRWPARHEAPVHRRGTTCTHRPARRGARRWHDASPRASADPGRVGLTSTS